MTNYYKKYIKYKKKYLQLIGGQSDVAVSPFNSNKFFLDNLGKTTQIIFIDELFIQWLDEESKALAESDDKNSFERLNKLWRNWYDACKTLETHRRDERVFRENGSTYKIV